MADRDRTVTVAPFDTTRMIPEGWSAHHQAVVETAYNARVIITDPARTTPGTLDPDTGTYGPPTPHVVAGDPTDTNPDWRDGVPCRIQRQRDDRPVDHAGQDVTIRFYLIQFPADLPDVEVGHVATVLEARNDAHLVGEQLTASDVFHGSERFSRDIVWVHNQAPPTPDEEG